MRMAAMPEFKIKKIVNAEHFHSSSGQSPTVRTLHCQLITKAVHFRSFKQQGRFQTAIYGLLS